MKERLNKVVDRSVLLEEKKEELDAEVSRKETSSQKDAGRKTQKPAAKNNKDSVRKRTHGKQILISIVVVILLLLTAFKLYVDHSYEPSHPMETYQAMTTYEIENSDNAIAIQNTDAIARNDAIGFIIYGDERVERECYLPLMIALADAGYCAYLPTTFGNLPILNQEGAEYVIRTYKSVKTWYIIAHGKACPFAARYAKSHSSKINGLIYLGGASYHTDLSDQDLALLSITGSRDSLVDPQRIEAAKANDPVGSAYFSIEGGNHTGFLDTSLMKGDTPSQISVAEQIEQTVFAITSFVQQP